jgi:hypothetical protein
MGGIGCWNRLELARVLSVEFENEFDVDPSVFDGEYDEGEKENVLQGHGASN